MDDHGLKKATDEELWNIVVDIIEEYRDLDSKDLARVLYYATIRDQVDIINWLLDNYVDVDLSYQDEKGGAYYDNVQAAIISNHRVVKAFLSHGALADTENLDKALDTAIVKKKSRIARMLVGAGAKPVSKTKAALLMQLLGKY